MANLIQIAEELEYMPKDQLAQMTQDPNSTYPQFLVLSEIQRRTQLEKAYQAQATQAEPQTTVAEETVAEFMAPQGLQGMAQQPMPQDMPAPMPESPMQMMADGGRTGFFAMGATTYANQRPEDMQAMTQGMIDDISARYMDEDGTVNWSQAIKDGVITAATVATIAPSAAGATALGVGRGLLGAARMLTPTGIRQAGRNMLNRLGQFTLGKKYNLGPKSRFGSTQAIEAGKETAKKVAPRIIGGGILASQVLPEGSEEEDKPVTSPVVGPVVDDTDTIIDTDTGGTATKKGGLFSNITPDQGLTMAQLGGVLMGARNMSELGAGIAGVAGQMQERKSEAGLAGAQQAYYEAQAEQAKAEIEAMPEEQRIAKLKQYEAYAKLIQDGTVTLTPEELETFSSTYSLLLGVETQNDEDFFKGTKVG
tara:strand:- start:1721 stop:2989 length:1269 start_codon:yes stop_codon:yes gene_type:complete